MEREGEGGTIRNPREGGREVMRLNQDTGGVRNICSLVE